jgi:vacuolar protein sorting-associated protein IST1
MLSLFGGGFSRDKLKSHLSMSVQRLRLLRNKKSNELQIEKKGVAALLGARQFDKARIRVEAVLRLRRELEAEEILELMCELLVARIALISTEKLCPPDLAESVHTLVWAAPRTQAEELRVVREQLVHRYGEAFCQPALRAGGGGGAPPANW